jgi:hypothetical protein
MDATIVISVRRTYNLSQWLLCCTEIWLVIAEQYSQIRLRFRQLAYLLLIDSLNKNFIIIYSKSFKVS